MLTDKRWTYFYQLCYVALYSGVAYAVRPRDWNHLQIPPALVFFTVLCVAFETWATLYQANVWAYAYKEQQGELPKMGCLNNIWGIVVIIIRIMFPIAFVGMAWKALDLPTHSILLIGMMLVFVARETYTYYRLQTPTPVKPRTVWVLLSNLLLVWLQVVYTYTIVCMFTVGRDFQIVLNGNWGEIVFKTLLLLGLFLFFFLPYRLLQIYREVIFFKTKADYAIYSFAWLLIVLGTLSPAFRLPIRQTWENWEKSLQMAKNSEKFSCASCQFSTHLSMKSVSALCELQHLRHISFENVPIFILPACILKMPRLKEIDFGNQRGINSVLPNDTEVYKSCQSLQVLSMRKYDSQSFPFQLRYLPNLQVLKIGTPARFDANTRLRWLMELKTMKALRELHLYKTQESIQFQEELKIKLPNLIVKWF